MNTCTIKDQGFFLRLGQILMMLTDAKHKTLNQQSFTEIIETNAKNGVELEATNN